MKNKIYYENFKDAIERNRKKIPAVHKKLKAAGVQYVMSSWIDLHGIPKTKPVPMSDFEQLCLGKGPQFAVHSISFVPELTPADSDQIMLPDLDSVYICPWDKTMAIIFADLYWEDKPYNVCPRQALKRAMQKAQDAGYKGMCGIEPEFIAMKYGEDGKPIKAIDSDPINGIRPRRQAFGYDVEYSLVSMHFLKELIDIGDPFYVYRGFVIDGDERIRMGKRDDGADYWKQDAGSGISYSLNRDTAIYFAYWNLVNENGNTIPEVNESMKENRWWIHKLPPTIISFEEYAKEMEWEIYRIRELEIMKGKKPILCKYLIDPETIRTFAMQSFESELMIEPSDVCLEKYSILTSKEMGIGVTQNRYQSLRDWDDVTGLYNNCLLYTSPSPRDVEESRMPSSA